MWVGLAGIEIAPESVAFALEKFDVGGAKAQTAEAERLRSLASRQFFLGGIEDQFEK